ncbi:MAG: HPr family phosphocarrier protein [Lachnospiraceae bacterium]
MKEKKIRLNAAADIQEFVSAAEKCEFDIDVFYDRIHFDAKSMLGVFSFGFAKEVTVEYVGENPVFETILEKYSILQNK